MNCEAVVNHITDWLHQKALAANKKGFVLGISGGIDSAVVSTLCARTGLNLLCISMPINQAPDQLNRAHEHCNWLKSKWNNVSAIKIDLTYAEVSFEVSIPDEFMNDLAKVNSRSRIRMMTLYSAANSKNLLVAGTGNKIEDYGVFFYTKYGDGGVDLNPIGDLLKTEVYEIAKYLEIIPSIQAARPTDGLWGDNRSDEDQIGASYPELEWAMGYCENLKIVSIQDLDNHFTLFKDNIDTLFSKRQAEVLKIYVKRHWGGMHKMSMPPICQIPQSYK